MPVTLTGLAETDYFLPEDGPVAQADFLAMLKAPGETWIAAYGFTLQPLFDEIIAADAAGVPIHILLDHTQDGGKAEAPEVQRLVNALSARSDVTITTAGPGSAAPSQIMHEKAMVVYPPANEAGVTPEPWCWEGSVNFSQSGWLQANTARRFASSLWAARFVAAWTVHRNWALANEAEYQVKKAA